MESDLLQKPSSMSSICALIHTYRTHPRYHVEYRHQSPQGLTTPSTHWSRFIGPSIIPMSPMSPTLQALSHDRAFDISMSNRRWAYPNLRKRKNVQGDPRFERPRALAIDHGTAHTHLQRQPNAAAATAVGLGCVQSRGQSA